MDEFDRQMQEELAKRRETWLREQADNAGITSELLAQLFEVEQSVEFDEAGSKLLVTMKLVPRWS